jgi:hypothetical protein
MAIHCYKIAFKELKFTKAEWLLSAQRVVVVVTSGKFKMHTKTEQNQGFCGIIVANGVQLAQICKFDLHCM